MKSGRKPTFLLHEDRNELILRIQELGSAAVAGTGIEMVDVQLKGSGPSRLLRLYIDRVGGVTHGDCELVSERISRMLDEGNVIPDDQPYTLEVSSPGPDRRLVTACDFERVVGQKIDLTVKNDGDVRIQVRGRLLSVKDEHLEVAVTNGDPVRVSLGHVHKAKLRFEP